MGLAYICLFITAGGTLLFANPILSLFKLTPETTAVALRLRFYFCIVVTLYPLAFTITPCLRAAGDVRFCLIGAMTGMWLGRILCSHLFVSFGWGIMGVGGHCGGLASSVVAFYLPRYLERPVAEERYNDRKGPSPCGGGFLILSGTVQWALLFHFSNIQWMRGAATNMFQKKAIGKFFHGRPNPDGRQVGIAAGRPEMI